MKTVHRPSVLPIYAIGVVWIVFCAAGSLHTVGGFIACALVSVLAFFAMRLLFPGTTEEIPVEEAKPNTGNPALDAAIETGRSAMKELKAIHDRVTKPSLSAQLRQLEQLTGDIFASLQRHPETLPQLQTFLDYYLPTTLKLLRSYDELQQQSVQGENIRGAMDSIEGMLDTVLQGFRKQLDSLYASQSVDITADVAVLQRMMASQGLSQDKDF